VEAEAEAVMRIAVVVAEAVEATVAKAAGVVAVAAATAVPATAGAATGAIPAGTRSLLNYRGAPA
jgi:hypothetical protein